MESGIKNHYPSKNQMSNQGAQRVITTFARQGHDRRRLKNELAFEIKRVRVVEKRLKRQNLEIEKMRELMKARHELEVLESQQRLAKIYQELQEVRDRVSRLKAQHYLPLYKTTSYAPISRKPINSLSYQNIERNCIVVPRAKVLPRNNEHRNSTKRDDGIRAEELPKETVSKSCIKENRSDEVLISKVDKA